MDAQVKKAWVEALRSGDYEQGRGRLFRDGKYCCLGVYCRVAGLPIEANGYARREPGKNVYDLVPQSCTLWMMNDGGGKTFAEIADWIEANL